MLAVHRLGEEVVHLVAGLVVVHRDLFEDHASLSLHIGLGEDGVDHEVAHDIDRERQVGVEYPRVVAGVLLRGEGVRLAADGLDRRRDLQRGAAPRCP